MTSFLQRLSALSVLQPRNACSVPSLSAQLRSAAVCAVTQQIGPESRFKLKIIIWSHSLSLGESGGRVIEERNILSKQI